MPGRQDKAKPRKGQRPQQRRVPQPPAPKARARPARMRVPDIFDPRSPALVPTVVSEGAAFPMSGSTVQAINAPTTVRTILAVANTGVSGSVLGFVTNNATPGAGVSTIPLLAAGSDAGGPTSGRAMKSGVTIINRTQLLNQGGQLCVLNAIQRLSFPAAPSAMTQAQWNEVADGILAHPRSRLFSGADFAKSKTFVNHPLDQTDYLSYQGWRGSLTVDEFWAHLAVWPGSSHATRPMSTTLIVLEPPAVQNTYEVKTRSMFYTRWPLDSVPGQAHRAVPTASPQVVNAHRDFAEAVGHLPREEIAAAGVGGAALGGAAAWATGAMRAAQAVGEGVELFAPLLAAI